MDDAEWCNGNTNDSDSFIPGSNPGSAASKEKQPYGLFFLCLFYHLDSKPRSAEATVLLSPRPDFRLRPSTKRSEREREPMSEKESRFGSQQRKAATPALLIRK